jgi:hypothetical protein
MYNLWLIPSINILVLYVKPIFLIMFIMILYTAHNGNADKKYGLRK